MDINLKGTFLSVQKVLKDMRERRWGRIVLLGSMLSSIGLESRSVYSASKAAILGLTKTLALETVQDGICVNAICPGPFATEMNVSVMENRETNQFFVDRIPMGRWADPNEIRGIVLYLCSQSCSFMTGSSIMIDGGWTAR
jgi:NAD(P)-dependent dehydrogenase (short-subunit alcohol dehydrogenase family)